MPDTTLRRHHIHKLTRLAAVLDRQGRHAEADHLDRIVRQAQAWNPIRTFKNTRNWWTQTLNGDNPTLLLRNMQDALERLSQDASRQTWFAGPDDRVRPVALAIVAKVLENFRGYADRFNAASKAPTAHLSSPPRTASLAMGVARDCNDIIGLLGPLVDENTFKGGVAVYNTLKADLTTLSNLLTEQITPAQAVAQSGVSAASTSARGRGEGPLSPAPSVPQSLAVTPGSYKAVTAPSAYSATGEQYMDQTYQRELHQPGSPEWENELQNSMAWGLRNGGLQNLLTKMQQDGHTPQFLAAVQQAWRAKGLPTEPMQGQSQSAEGAMSASAAPLAQARLMN